MIVYRLLSFTVILLYILFTATVTLAVTVTISNVPSTISDQPFSIDASVSGAQAGTNYLRANLFPPGTTKYFGYTFNGTTFVNSSDFSQYFPITIDSSSNWSGTIQAKLDTSSSYYSGPGTYSLKVRRYTQSGSTYTWSNEISLVVNLSTPTPTSTPTSTPFPTSSPPPSTSSFTISNIPSQINSDEVFNVSVNLSLPNNPNTNFYLKGAFKKSDSSNYFGLTKVSGNWIKNGSTYLSQYSITTDSSGNWSGNLEVKPDTEDAGYIGTDDYTFKVSRYTSSGSGPTWSNESTIKIINTSSDNQGGASKTSTSSTNPTSSPQTSKSKVTDSQQSKNYDRPVYHTASVAAATVSATPTSNVEVKTEKRANFIPWIGVALIFCGIGSLIFIYLRQRKIYEKIHNLLRKRD